MGQKNLQIQQLDRKIIVFAPLQQVPVPPTGWIRAIRAALGMSLQQLGNKLSITKQSARAIEIREKEGTITLKSLREVGKAIDMHFVYGFVPHDGSLDALIERKARELATQIVHRTSTTMRLEDQENTKQRLGKAIEERTAAIKNEVPKILWE
jgi:predicted DNA-binding mobile mystery protein A